jgi:hypothetical protein
MTKKELVEFLSHWSDDTIIEISVCPDSDSMSDGQTNKRSYEIVDIEKPQNSEDPILIIGGRVTMY